VAVVLAEVCWWGITIADGTWTVRYSLPLHLCEAGCFIVAAALWWRTRFAFEVSYFWGLGGTLPGLFTPDVPGHFPEPVYFQYYAEHGLLVLYAAAVGAVDFVTGGNYLFLRDIPPTQTILDYLGPWPWYIVTLTAMALIVFTLLYLPFAGRSPDRAPAESSA
jgi:uncharacterized membrane protein YwaF